MAGFIGLEVDLDLSSAATFIDGYGHLMRSVRSSNPHVRSWVRSGDECYFDEDGEIYVVDRIKVRNSLFCDRPLISPRTLLSKYAASRLLPQSSRHALPLAPTSPIAVLYLSLMNSAAKFPRHMYVVLSQAAMERVSRDSKEGDKIKLALIQVAHAYYSRPGPGN